MSQRHPQRPKPARSDTATVLYGEKRGSTYHASLRGASERLADHVGLTAAERTQHVEQMGRAFADAEIPPTQAASIYARCVGALIRPPDAAQRDQWATDSNRHLRETYGEQAETRIKAARDFVAQRPELAQLLRESGTGDHPEIVTALAENARSLRIEHED